VSSDFDTKLSLSRLPTAALFAFYKINSPSLSPSFSFHISSICFDLLYCNTPVYRAVWSNLSGFKSSYLASLIAFFSNSSCFSASLFAIKSLFTGFGFYFSITLLVIVSI